MGAERSTLDVASWEIPDMPQMFDWIFFAIMIPPPVLLLWDLLRNR